MRIPVRKLGKVQPIADKLEGHIKLTRLVCGQKPQIRIGTRVTYVRQIDQNLIIDLASNLSDRRDIDKINRPMQISGPVRYEEVVRIQRIKIYRGSLGKPSIGAGYGTISKRPAGETTHIANRALSGSTPSLG